MANWGYFTGGWDQFLGTTPKFKGKIIIVPLQIAIVGAIHIPPHFQTIELYRLYRFIVGVNIRDVPFLTLKWLWTCGKPRNQTSLVTFQKWVAQSIKHFKIDQHGPFDPGKTLKT